MTENGKSRWGATVALVTATILAGCANVRGPHPDLPPLGARMEFLSRNLCSEGVSPEIRLGGVPGNTAYYRLRITNTSVLAAPRADATIKAESPVIPEGALSDFDAPCPGELQAFNYRLEVMALADDGRSLAYGWAFASARALTKQIQQEQDEIKRRLADRPDRKKFPEAKRPPLFIQ